MTSPYAELVLCAFDGTALDRELSAELGAIRPGGYILYARNCTTPEGTRALTDALRSLHGDGDASPLIAVDQEGGRVVRQRLGVEPIPPAMALAATGDPALVHAVGHRVAHDLRRIGCSIDLAPVLDLASQPRSTVIGTRAFGDDPHHVSRFAAAFADGLRAGGVLPVFKHFPGHGATALDSHEVLPVVDACEELLRARDLLPFSLSLRRAEAVMTAHVVVRSLDPARPATLSPRILGEILRGDCAFGGVCFSDAMGMAAIARNQRVEDAVVDAIAAGVDMVIIDEGPARARACVAALDAAVRTSRLPAARVEEALRRISRLKAAVAPPSSADVPDVHAGIGRAAARAAITCVRGWPHVRASDAIVVESESPDESEVAGTVADASLSWPAEVPVIRLAREPTAERRRAICDVVVASGRRPVLALRRAHLSESTLQAARELLAVMPETIVVSLLEPFDALALPQARHVVCAYGDDPLMHRALCEVVFDGYPPRGRLPVSW